MKHLAYMAWLASQAAGGLDYQLPVTLLLAFLAASALMLDIYCRRLQFVRQSFYLLLPATGIPLFFLVGTLFEEHPSMAFLPVVCFVFIVVLADTETEDIQAGLRRTTATTLCYLWYSSWCWFVAGMSITGDWL